MFAKMDGVAWTEIEMLSEECEKKVGERDGREAGWAISGRTLSADAAIQLGKEGLSMQECA